jgi:hypothetical protein
VASWQALPAGASEATESTAAAESIGSAAWLNSATPRIEQWTKSQDGLGYYWDQAARQYVVRVTGDRRSRAAAVLTASSVSAPVRLEDATASKEAVDQTLSLVEGRAWYPGGQKSGLGVYYDPIKDVTVVETDAPTGAVDTLKRSVRTPIEVQHAELDLKSRHSDGAPHSGGADIDNERTNQLCTSGYTMQDLRGIRYQLTAGHCGEPSDQFYSGRNYYGWIANKAPFPTYDLAALRCLCPDYQPRIYVTEDATLPVKDTLVPTVGMQDVIISGAGSGTSGARQVTSTDATLCARGVCVHHLISTSGGHVAPGDSGAPMYKFLEGGVWALGIVIGGDGNANPVSTFAESMTSVHQAFGIYLLNG